MLQTIEATIDEQGRVHLLEPSEDIADRDEPSVAALAESALAVDTAIRWWSPSTRPTSGMAGSIATAIHTWQDIYGKWIPHGPCGRHAQDAQAPRDGSCGGSGSSMQGCPRRS